MSRLSLLTVVALAACRIDTPPLSLIEALAEGDTNCPAGGVAVHSGLDNNYNFTLEESEISNTDYVCNGVDGTGADGATGQTGADGADGDDGASVVYIDVDTTWSTDQELVGTTVVSAGATLTISAGVTVTFLPQAALWVEGVVALEADTSGGVTFEPRFTSHDNGVFLVGSSPSTLDSGTFEGIDVASWDQALDGVADVVFRDAGLRVEGHAASAFTVATSRFEATSPAYQVGLTLNDTGDVTVSDSTFDGLSGPNIEASATSLTVTNSSFSDAGADMINTDEDSVLVGQGLTMTGSARDCVDAAGDAQLSDSTISGCYSTGIRSSGPLDLDGVSIADSGYGIYQNWNEPTFGAPADVSVVDVTIERSGFYAMYLSRGGSLDGVSVDQTGSYALYLGGGPGFATSVVDTEVTAAGNIGVYALQTDTITMDGVTVSDNMAGDCLNANSDSQTLSNLTLTNCASDALEVHRGGTVRNVTITDPVSNGIRLNGTSNDLLLEDVEVTGAGVRGLIASGVERLALTRVTVDGSGNDGIYTTAATATFDTVVTTNNLHTGMELRGGDAQVTNSTSHTNGQYGIWLYNGSISASLVHSNVSHGVNMDGWLPGSLSNSIVRDNGDNGVQCRHSGDDTRSMFDVIDNNITGNEGVYDGDGLAVDHCRLVDNNYIGMNGGFTVRDNRRNAGTLDDNRRDTDGETAGGAASGQTQIEDVDRVDRRRTELIVGIGPS